MSKVNTTPNRFTVLLTTKQKGEPAKVYEFYYPFVFDAEMSTYGKAYSESLDQFKAMAIDYAGHLSVISSMKVTVQLYENGETEAPYLIKTITIESSEKIRI